MQQFHRNQRRIARDTNNPITRPWPTLNTVIEQQCALRIVEVFTIADIWLHLPLACSLPQFNLSLTNVQVLDLSTECAAVGVIMCCP